MPKINQETKIPNEIKKKETLVMKLNRKLNDLILRLPAYAFLVRAAIILKNL